VEAATVYGDRETLVELGFELDRDALIADNLPAITAPDKLAFILLKLMNTGRGELAIGFLRNSNPNNLPRFAPVLIEAPSDSAVALISDRYLLSESLTKIMISSLCKCHDEDRLINLLLEGCLSPVFLLRFCRQYGCHKAASRALLALHKVEQAVDLGVRSFGVEYAHFLLDLIGDRAERKRGFVHLFAISSREDNVETLKLIRHTDLFEFSELIEFADDELPLAHFAEGFTELVTSLEEQSIPHHHQTSFPELPIDSFTVELTDRCELCQKRLIGSRFSRFPCGHMVHMDCLARNVSESCRDLRVKPNLLDSCPICGFLAVSRILDDFDDSIFRANEIVFD
jgi:hypothetical protein